MRKTLIALIMTGVGAVTTIGQAFAADKKPNVPKEAAGFVETPPKKETPKPAEKKPPAPVPLPAGVKAIRDVEYAKVGEKSLLLDIYAPEAPKGPLPLIVWIHGGAWRGGWKENPYGLRLTEKGYILASINYRLSPEAVFPAQIEDCKGAIRFLRAHAKKYSIDADHIGVAGDSAGGHLAALLGASGGDKELEGDVGGNSTVSSRVQCVVDFFGPSDMMKFKGQPVWPKIDQPQSPLCQLFGGLLADKQDLVAKANPITHITKDCPPFLVAHGNRDGTVPFNQSELLVAALKKAGVDVTFEVAQNADHGLHWPPFDRVHPIVDAFFDKHLKPAAPKK